MSTYNEERNSTGCQRSHNWARKTFFRIIMHGSVHVLFWLFLTSLSISGSEVSNNSVLLFDLCATEMSDMFS